MEKSTQERAPGGLTEDKPALGPVVFLPLLLVLALVIGLVFWLAATAM